MKDLYKMSVDAFAYLLQEACNLGAEDERNGRRVKSGIQVIDALEIGNCRKGHVRFLKRAYMAGRWHIEVSGQP